jgi:hypothetical protein
MFEWGALAEICANAQWKDAAPMLRESQADSASQNGCF